MQISHQWDVIVVGAGAAGLMAAASAASRSRRVLVLEKNSKLGVKILMSGGTRCNITHHCDARQISEAFGTRGKMAPGNFLRTALATLPPDEVIRMVEGQGVATKIESTGKIFPVSNRAIDVRDALVRIAESSGAQIQSSSPVKGISRITSETGSESSFRVTTESNQFECSSVIVTTGGMSYPGCGTTGDGYEWAKSFAHEIIVPVPALTPIACNTEWANLLKGVTLPFCQARILESDSGKELDSQRGSLLFTHFGFSGPAVLNLSRAISNRESPKGLAMEFDYLPDESETQLNERFQSWKSTDGKQAIATSLSMELPKRLVSELLAQASVMPSRVHAELTKVETRQIIHQLKSNRLPVGGVLGFKKAEVTSGGVSLASVSSKTMESRRVAGLYFAGEVLDVDGPIGGFNFQAAFSTGWLAGQHA